MFSAHYTGTHSAKHPLIPPCTVICRDSPVFINAAMDDELYDDAERFYLKAKKVDVDFEFRSGVGRVHCYPLLSPMFREAAEAMDEIRTFIRRRLEI
ncbi:MAG: alpha/beta hydrolase [candidate division KSB1 bacterium]|nr:alpha/beta hydrolase [candidate division KSB1 bacterium]